MKRSVLFCALLGLGLLAPTVQAQDDTLVLRGDKIYLSPEQPPLRDGALLIRGGRIVSVGPAKDLPPDAPPPLAACSGAVLTAGFTNSHVHLLGPHWGEAATASA